jgi:4-amino-4-deoxy-L-arabinose transferase-like glycosyltransferase
VAAVLAFVHLLLTLAVLVPAPHLGGDNAAYLGLAKGLLSGRGYVEMWDPAMRPHGQYPPGWPVLIAAALAVGVKPWTGIKLLVALLSSGAVAVSYLWARRVAGAGVALAACAVLAVVPGLLVQSARELSDVPFWLFFSLALWAFAHASPGPEGGLAATDASAADASAAPPGTALRWIAGGALATACAWLTRSAALPLVLAVVAWLAWQRRWRGLGVFVAVFAPLPALWWLHQHSAVPGGSYVNAFWWKDPYLPYLGRVDAAGMVHRVLSNAGKYLSTRLPGLLLSTGPEVRPIPTAVGVLVWSLALTGWARRLRKPGLPELFLAPYLGLLLVWPDEWADERYLLPILPLLLVYAAQSVVYLSEALPRPRLTRVAAVAVLLVAAVPGFAEDTNDATICRAGYPDQLDTCYPQMWAEMFSVYAGINGALPPGSVVMTRKATLTWALSGYQARTYPFSANADTFFTAARQVNAHYVVLDGTPEASRYLNPIIFAHREDFCAIKPYVHPGAVLLAISRNHRPLPPNAKPDELVYCN